MKDLLKRLLCVLMALAMVACLAACGSSEEEDDDKGSSKKSKKSSSQEEDTLVGEWEAEIDITDYIASIMESQGFEMDLDDFVMVMTVVFDEDGTYEAEIDTAKMEKAMKNFANDLWDLMVEMVAEQGGMSESEAEAALEDQGYTKDVLLEEMGIEGMFEDLEAESGDWELDGDELDLDGSVVTIEFDGDEFSIVDVEDDDSGMAEILLPIVFERQ